MTFIEHIDYEMRKRNWSRYDLANRAGINASYLSMLATKKRSVGPTACKKIAHALDLPVETVYLWAGILEHRKRGNPLINELVEIVDNLNNNDIVILIDLARLIEARRSKTTDRD